VEVEEKVLVEANAVNEVERTYPVYTATKVATLV
jgi:hypothetical protein